MNFIIKIINYILPNGLIAAQLKKPSGFLGKFIGYRLERQNEKTYGIVLKNLDPNENDEILEIGYGPGFGIYEVSKKIVNGHVYGIDFSDSMFVQASKKNKLLIKENKVYLDKCDSLKMPYSDNKFDKVFGVNIVYFWEQPVEHLKEILRVLKPDAYAMFYLTCKSSLKFIPVTNSKEFKKYDEKDFSNLMKEAGFNKITPIIFYEEFKGMNCKGIIIKGYK